MAGQGRIGVLPAADRQAIFSAAQQLQLDPYEFGALLSLESGANMDPNIWGGGGGKYYGMIQFGPNEQRTYLDPSKIGKYTRAEQIPKAVRFLSDRGYKPGMGIEKAYATILGGNPNVSLEAKDSFGTSVSGAVPRFRPGGDLYKNAQRVLGDPIEGYTSAAQTASAAPSGSTGAGPGQQEYTVQTTRRPVRNEEAFRSLMGEIMGGFGGGATRDNEDEVFVAMAATAMGDPRGEELLNEALSKPETPRGSNLGRLVDKFIAASTPNYVTELNIAPKQGAAPAATNPVATGGPSSTETVGLVDIGKRLQGAGLRVREHEAFGGVGKHTPGSLHYKNLALDITDWQDPGESQSSWLPRKKFLAQRFSDILGSSAQVFGPHNDPAGHGTHIHLGVPSGSLPLNKVQLLESARQEALKRYPLRWSG